MTRFTDDDFTDRYTPAAARKAELAASHVGTTDPIVTLKAEAVRLEQLAELSDSDEHDEALSRIDDEIDAAVPASIAGALIQARRLAEIGRDFLWDDWHDRLADNLIAGLERLAAG